MYSVFSKIQMSLINIFALRRKYIDLFDTKSLVLEVNFRDIDKDKFVVNFNTIKTRHFIGQTIHELLQLLAEKDPFLENIRGEPRFKKLMERVKHEWENFEV